MSGTSVLGVYHVCCSLTWNTNVLNIDCISTEVTKFIRCHIAVSLTFQIINSLEMGVFPNEVKQGIVVLIFNDHSINMDYTKPITIIEAKINEAKIIY